MNINKLRKLVRDRLFEEGYVLLSDWEVIGQTCNLLRKKYPDSMVTYSVSTDEEIATGKWVQKGHEAEFCVFYENEDAPRIGSYSVYTATADSPRVAVYLAALKVAGLTDNEIRERCRD